jgi:hypothetical protein
MALSFMRDDVCLLSKYMLMLILFWGATPKKQERD